MNANVENVGGAIPMVPVPLAEAEVQPGAVPIADVAPEPAQQPDVEMDEPNEPDDAIVIPDSSQSQQNTDDDGETNQNVPVGETTPQRNKRKWCVDCNIFHRIINSYFIKLRSYTIDSFVGWMKRTTMDQHVRYASIHGKFRVNIEWSPSNVAIYSANHVSEGMNDAIILRSNSCSI